MDLSFWWLFPVSIVIAATANGAGIGGATFFSPLFLIVLGLEPVIAIGAALLTEVFGFASGVVAHARAKAIDWLAVRRLVAVSAPLAVVGSLLAGFAPETLLKLLLGFGLLFIAVTFIQHHDPVREDEEIAVFTIPGVIIGGQLGPRITGRVPNGRLSGRSAGSSSPSPVSPSGKRCCDERRSAANIA